MAQFNNPPKYAPGWYSICICLIKSICLISLDKLAGHQVKKWRSFHSIFIHFSFHSEVEGFLYWRNLYVAELFRWCQYLELNGETKREKRIREEAGREMWRQSWLSTIIASTTHDDCVRAIKQPCDTSYSSTSLGLLPAGLLVNAVVSSLGFLERKQREKG